MKKRSTYNGNILEKIAKRFLLKRGYSQLHQDAHTSFSQMAEDLILERLFLNQKKGFYVDIGAFHPTLYSNTYIFYQKGWRGINIDAMPDSMNLFKSMRPRDINIEAVISKKEQDVTYYTTNSGALNTIVHSRKLEIDTLKDHVVTGEIKLHATTINDLLDLHMPKRTSLDFMSIDIEGLDYEILTTVNWHKYRPKVIIVEALDFSFENILNHRTYKYLHKNKYVLESKTGVSLIFRSTI